MPGAMECERVRLCTVAPWQQFIKVVFCSRPRFQELRHVRAKLDNKYPSLKATVDRSPAVVGGGAVVLGTVPKVLEREY